MTPTLWRMLLLSLLPVLLIALVFFVLILQLVDLFANLWRYLNQDVPPSVIARIQLYYLPFCVRYGLPMAFLFALSFTLGELYTRNELIAVLGSGTPLVGFLAPAFVLAVGLIGVDRILDERAVVEGLADKSGLVNAALNYNPSFNNSNVAIIGSNPNVVYVADFYNDSERRITGMAILERNDEGDLVRRIEGETARWNGTLWELSGVTIYTPEPGGMLRTEQWNVYTEPGFADPPESFRRPTRKVEELATEQASEWIASLKTAGLPYREQLVSLYRRYSHSFVYVVIALVSVSFAGRFRKNVLLMSLLVSLSLVVGYYVLQMVLVLLARLGYVSPLLGAWGALAAFLAAGTFALRLART